MLKGEHHTKEFKFYLKKKFENKHFSPATEFKKGHIVNIGRKLSIKTKEKISLGNKGKVRSKEFRSNVGKNMREYFKKNEVWNKGLTNETDERVRKISGNKNRNNKISKYNKGRKITWVNKIVDTRIKNNSYNPTDLTRKKMSAKKQEIDLEDWKGFSKEPYSQNWDLKFKNEIRKRDNQICMNCGIHREKLDRALDIHHINYDKQLTIPENCISLCGKCHKMTISNREYWINLFQNKLSKLYGYQYKNKEVIIEI